MRRNHLAALLFGVMGLVVMLLPAGCGGGDDGADPLNIVGSWQITAVGYEGITPAIVVTITAHASPTNVTATATGGGDYVTGVTVTTEGVPGVESPRGITITVNFSDGSWGSFAGTVGDDNAGMSGRYSNSQGSSDTWSARRI